MVRAFSIFCGVRCFVCRVSTCFTKVRLGSNVRSSIFMFLSVGSVVLFIVSLSFVECTAGYGVNNIVCVLRGF